MVTVQTEGASNTPSEVCSVSSCSIVVAGGREEILLSLLRYLARIEIRRSASEAIRQLLEPKVGDTDQ